MYSMNFSSKLKELRVQRGISQLELSKVINTSQSAIAFWENNEKSPTLENLAAIADYFQISVDELIGRTNIVGVVEVRNELTCEETSLVQSFRQMNSAEKAVLNGYAEMIMKTHKGAAENKKSG